MKRLETIPKTDGFRMPGEFEPHDGCYILWPERPDNWRYGAKPAQHVFAEVAEKISKYERVTVGVNEKQYENARHLLPEQVRLIEISNNDSWIRDCGPTCVVNNEGEVRAIDWSFNSWGGLVEGLYFPWDKDDKVARKVAEIEEISYYRFDDFILEGGAIHTDGEGTVYTTEECLLAPDRNPNMKKEEIERMLCDTLGVEKVLWIPKGIYLDETNGHVDNICNVVRPGEVVLAWTDDEKDPQYEISKAAFDYLSNASDAKGRKIKIHKLLLPSPITITDEESRGVDAIEGTLPRKAGCRLAASYANYYTANNAIILPIFNDKNDELAIQKLSEVYPGYTIEPVYAREILLGGGNIHCITQQIPKRHR